MNKEKHTENGNIVNKNKMKIIVWNKGSCKIINGINEIRDIIEEKKPDVFIINEININNEIDIRNVNVKGYS